MCLDSELSPPYPHILGCSGVLPYQPSWQGSVHWSSDESNADEEELNGADSMDIYQHQDKSQVWRLNPRHIQVFASNYMGLF